MTDTPNRAREFWIQKGTPDIICDSVKEMNDTTDNDNIGLGLRADCEWIHVVEILDLPTPSDRDGDRIAKLARESAIENAAWRDYDEEEDDRQILFRFIDGANWADANPDQTKECPECNNSLAAASIHADEHRKLRSELHDKNALIEELVGALEDIKWKCQNDFGRGVEYVASDAIQKAKGK
jgi:hypothetical protein